ncbi:hypothetical protein A2U01_0103595, partial [Trifolium medium]|nr:hypothetical protein [Trifolium medium]
KEWDFSIGEDACLFEEDNEVLGSESEHLADHGDQEHRNNVDSLVEKISVEVVREEGELSANPKVHSVD